MDRYNHILVVDVDKKDFKKKAKSIRKDLENCPFIFSVFESPSGGFKALAYSRMKAEYHKLFFKGVQEYFMYKNVKIDSSGKNPGRLCFVSYDPDLYLEYKDKEPFTLQKFAPGVLKEEQDRRFRETRPIDYSQYQNSTNLEYIMGVAKKRAADYVGAYHKGNRNNYIFTLACILNKAGIEQPVAESIIMGNYPSLGPKEIETTVKSAYGRNQHEFGTRPILEKKTSQSGLF